MKIFFQHIFIVGIVTSLAGCSSFSSNRLQPQQNEYLKAQSAPVLRLPAGMKNSNLSEEYVVPNTDTPAPTKPVSLVPPNSLAEQVTQGKITTTALKQQEAQVAKMRSITPPDTINSADIDNGINGSFKNNALMLKQPAASAWLVVENAINNAGYKVLVKNSNTQTFYILDIISTNGMTTKTTPIYQIHLRTMPLGTQISVSDNDGKPAKLENANRILDNIYSALPKTPERRNTNNNPATQGVTPNANPSSNFGRLMNNILH